MKQATLSNKASGLADLQRAIAGALGCPLNADATMAPANRAVAEKFIRPNNRLTAFERLQIYNQQYWWRLLGAFGEDFPGLRAVLGVRKFDRLAAAYLQACGSISWNLRNVGSQLVDFLAAHPALSHPHTLLAIDVARVEWARILAFDEPGKKVVSSAKLARTVPDTLRLSLQPYLVLLELSHPVDDLMRKLKRTEYSVGSNAIAASSGRRSRRLRVRRSREPIYLVVHRVDLAVYYKRLDREAWEILNAVAKGSTLGEAVARGFADTRHTALHCTTLIQEWFSRWIEFGWFCDPSRQ